MEKPALPAQIIATFFGVGHFPVASGTAATAAGLGVVFVLHHATFLYLAVLVALFGLGVMASSHLARVLKNPDPGVVVIDEVVGIMIAFVGVPLSWPSAICGFFLFRAFDMFKIYPLNRFEALPGGWGVMMDDVMAGLYTNIVLSVAVRWSGI